MLAKAMVKYDNEGNTFELMKQVNLDIVEIFVRIQDGRQFLLLFILQILERVFSQDTVNIFNVHVYRRTKRL